MRKMTEAHKAALSAALTGRKKPSAEREGNHAWKGSAASYSAIHKWIGRHKKKTGSCEECGNEGRTEWANIDHEYRRELGDWREWCKSCHYRLDVERFGTRNRLRDSSGRYTN